MNGNGGFQNGSDIPGIDTPTSCCTGQSSYRSQSHTCIPTLSILDSPRRRTASKMQHDQTRLLHIFAQKLGHIPRDELVRDAMETILSQAILLCDFLIDGVCADMLRDCLMELCIEHGDVLGSREFLDAGFDDLERRRVVQWCEVGEVFKTMIGLIGDALCGFVVSSMDHPVNCDGDVVLLADLFEFFVVDQLIEHILECLLLCGYIFIDLFVFVDGFRSTSVFELWWW